MMLFLDSHGCSICLPRKQMKAKINRCHIFIVFLFVEREFDLTEQNCGIGLVESFSELKPMLLVLFITFARVAFSHQPELLLLVP